MIKMTMMWHLYYNMAFLHAQVYAFVPHVPLRSKQGNIMLGKLWVSSDDGGDKSDRIRRMLELSWDESKMGIVPKNPENAAKAAAESIMNSIDNGKRLCLVDLKMPEYEVTSGEDFYDETLAVEFCIQLAKNIGKLSTSSTPIMLKNGKAQRIVQRVIDAREQAAKEEEEKAMKEDERIRKELNIAKDVFDPASTAEKNPYTENDVKESFKSDADATEVDNDDGDEGDNDSPVPIMDSSMDVDAFRKQLTSNWDSSITTNEITSTEEIPTNVEPKRGIMEEEVDSSDPKSAEPMSPLYRLRSLLGDETVSSGADMFDDVIEAVDRCAIAETVGDDVIIILSSSTNEEMIAVRRLVAKSWESKTLIFVNCKLDPMPREFYQAGAVVSYSLMPLALQNVENPDEQSGMKIVVLRRYPMDWEVYIDGGSTLGDDGFQFVESVPKRECIGEQGPPIEYISMSINKYIEFRTNGRT